MPVERVAIVTERLDGRGGVQHRTAKLAQGLMDSGCRVDVYSNRCRKGEVPGAQFHHLPMIRLGKAMRPISFALLCSALVRDGKYDIVHTQSRIFRFDLATLGIGCHKAYMEAVGVDIESAPDRLYHRMVLAIERAMMRPRPYPWLIANSHMCRKEIEYYYGMPENTVRVVYNGVDSDAFSAVKCSEARDAVRARLGLSPGDCAVLYVGSGFHRKGVRTLIGALSRMRALGSVRLLLVGGGSTDEFDKHAAECGVSDRMQWLGFSASVLDQYSAADIFVLPTLYDPFANATMEALACGLPVVTTTMNGVSEILHDGEDAYITDPNDPAGLAERLDTLVGDPDLRRRMGEAGRVIVEPFTWEKTTTETMAVYDEVMAAKDGR